MKKFMLAFTVMKNWENAVAIIAHKGSPRHPLLMEALMVSKLSCIIERNSNKLENNFIYITIS